MDPMLRMSATELAAQIRSGSIRSAEVVEAHIRRIAALNPTLNAVVADRFAAARAEAAAADQALSAPWFSTKLAEGTAETVRGWFGAASAVPEEKRADSTSPSR